VLGKHDGSAEAAWEALQDLADNDEELRAVLAQLSKAPLEGKRALLTWLAKRAGANLPPAIATYLSGGQTERLVNIAQAQHVVVSATTGVSPFGNASPVYGLVMRRTIQTANADGSVTTAVIEYFSEELALQSLREDSLDQDLSEG
jgi:hypothetical protein